ncbi:heavy metal translocating P-type ATPase [Halomonas organivorans]|uniref:P-type Zn(2+) transporter n=1 Tax=Halomonas organivorans TaxID=257772 RepID=A0A7W5BY49_9GAMM|nr:heavy metal translocating P-type ATPase [Halomonas organivorans]MBB3141296.1 Cd2+/Zn2+-exporting ATPase [Halomonas organivorans]
MACDAAGTQSRRHHWRVEGMDCPSCAGKIRGALERLDGVEDVRVSVMQGSLALALDAGKTAPETVETLVERLGYGVRRQAYREQDEDVDVASEGGCAGHDHQHDPAVMDDASAQHDHETTGTPRVWAVGGMDCPSCAATIRGALETFPGVENIRVSVMNETLTLSLDETRTSPESITARVRQLGYEAALNDASPDASLAKGDAAPRRRWYATAKGRQVLATGAALAAAMLLRVTVGEAVAHWAFLAACLVGLVPVARRAITAARVGMPFTIEMLMTLAAAGALIIGAAEEAAMVVLLFSIGEILEGVAADRARSGIRALADLVPREALLEVAPGETSSVDAARLAVGQVVIVRPGDRIPADGLILEGRSSIDESPVTGESVPRVKGEEDEVFAGSINHDAVLRLRVSRPPEDNTIARIIRLVEEAQEARAPTERFIDRFSRVYMPAVVGLAVLVAVVPPLALGGAWGEWIYRSLALLLIGCPCALVISVPASIASSLSTGARRGLLLKGGAVIEAAARTEVVGFDKTGTLTAGRPQVTDVVAAGEAHDTDAVIGLAASLEQGSSHPLAVAVLDHARSLGVAASRVSEARALPGRGVEARCDGREAFLGAPRHVAERWTLPEALAARVDALEAEGKTVIVAVEEGVVLGAIAMRDEPRDDAANGVQALSALGVRAVMLTGDNDRTAAAIAGTIGLERRAELLPEGKVEAIRELAGRERVMMIGDGINDAPALASAHVGVAMGSGTDVALETADGALLRNRVGDVASMIRLARATMTNIRQNIAIALGLKGLFLVTTVLGITGLWLAILADTGATVLVTLNALRLLGFAPGGRDAQEEPVVGAASTS